SYKIGSFPGAECISSGRAPGGSSPGARQVRGGTASADPTASGSTGSPRPDPSWAPLSFLRTGQGTKPAERPSRAGCAPDETAVVPPVTGPVPPPRHHSGRL